MENTYRLKIKIGEHEFEAEGAPDIVQKQFQAFKELIVSLPAKDPEPFPKPPLAASGAVPLSNLGTNMPPNGHDLAKIMKVTDRIISLTVQASSLEDAAMLILYGQKEMRGNELCTGGDVMSGLTATGGFAVSRIDKTLAKLGRDGDVIVIGEHRSKRYRLTNSGLTKVRQIASDLLATVA